MRRPSDLQMYYQRNMFYAMLIMTFGFISVSILLNSLSSENIHSPNSNTSISLFAQNIINDNSSKKSEALKAVRSISKFNPYVEKHEGFLGFKDIVITNKVDKQVTVFQPVFSIDNSIEINDDLPISFSISEGIDTGIYISDIGDDNFAFGMPAKTQTSFSRKIEVLRQVDPEYPWVAKESGKEGTVSTLVYIDSQGNYAMFPEWIKGESIKTLEYVLDNEKRLGQYLIIEEPEGWFFAKNILDVLPKWRFSPRIENGKPVSSLLRINYTFCLMHNCEKYWLELISPSR